MPKPNYKAVTLHQDIVERLDAIAQHEGMTRNEYIEHLIAEREKAIASAQGKTAPQMLAELKEKIPGWSREQIADLLGIVQHWLVN